MLSFHVKRGSFHSVSRFVSRHPLAFANKWRTAFVHPFAFLGMLNGRTAPNANDLPRFTKMRNSEPF